MADQVIKRAEVIGNNIYRCGEIQADSSGNASAVPGCNGTAYTFALQFSDSIPSDESAADNVRATATFAAFTDCPVPTMTAVEMANTEMVANTVAAPAPGTHPFMVKSDLELTCAAPVVIDGGTTAAGSTCGGVALNTLHFAKFHSTDVYAEIPNYDLITTHEGWTLEVAYAAIADGNVFAADAHIRIDDHSKVAFTSNEIHIGTPAEKYDYLLIKRVCGAGVRENYGYLIVQVEVSTP